LLTSFQPRSHRYSRVVKYFFF